MRQLPLPMGPIRTLTFDNFLSAANGLAAAHLRSLVGPHGLQAPSSAPVYLWGPPGSGKTHLLRALAERCQAAGQGVGWLDGADPQPWVWSPDWALVVVDRCDTLDAAGQQAGFTLFVEAASHGTQVAAAGRVPPVDLPLRDDLRSRLAWGHVFAMQTPDEAETRAVLRRTADERDLGLSEEVMAYLLSRFPRDLHHLMWLLHALDEFGVVHGRRITVPMVRAMIADHGQLSLQHTSTA
ncbi:MAG: DnaA regulatory inactivator Hda [Chitinophagaceae bacterium]|nr:DnaA regulatory inactivator Hda [Rubrivivax sp.]